MKGIFKEFKLIRMNFFKLFLHLTPIQIPESIARFNHGIPVKYIKCQLLACSAVMACGNLFCLLIFLSALSAQTLSAHESFSQLQRFPGKGRELEDKNVH